jgi:hypothetical protein
MGYSVEQIKEVIDACYKAGTGGSYINQEHRQLVEIAGDILDGLVEEGRV